MSTVNLPKHTVTNVGSSKPLPKYICNVVTRWLVVDDGCGAQNRWNLIIVI